jgi:hypothetical protein
MEERKPAGDLGISRIDLPASGTHGWQVRLQRRGVRFQRYFGDRTWGGKRAALQRARQFRDRVLARLEQREENDAGDRRVRSHSATVRNRSGMVGVARVRNRSANGVYYESWQATWSPAPGRRKSVRFSILRYGDEEAFQLACEARRAAVGTPTTGRSETDND